MPTKMNAKNRKEAAQDFLMQALGRASYMITDSDWSEDEKRELMEEASRQMERIEKLFGYTPKSWGRS